jgi:histidinol-phosphate/aromatic aminotransferase/cobyric acid decarboxylase-like protein
MEFDDFMPELLKVCRRDENVLYAAGHVSPEIAIAADRAELKVHELFGVSPFAADANPVLTAIDSPARIVYVANPNRVTGANLGLADLDNLVATVPDGMVIIDEYYFDYFGISGIPLLGRYSNVAVLRSFTAAFGINSANSGYLVASPELIGRVREQIGPKEISNTVYRTISTTMANEETLGKRLKELHDESLRVATELNRIGLQCRITAADFLLVRVTDPTSVGNFLAQYRIPIENLDGYPQLQKYVRYRVQSYQSNDKFLEACKKMPPEYFKRLTTDRRFVTLRKGESAVPPPGTGRTSERLSRVTLTDNELVTK